MKEEFKKKRAAYESLLTRESPVYFQADNQEIDEKTRIFILSGNVEIWKDMFKLKADRVTINQWSGQVQAEGNVVLEFAEDVLTGDKADYNFNTGTGWISNARAAVSPQLFLEAETLEKLPNLESNGQGQYAIHDGMLTACSSENPAWRFDTNYAVVRLENYAHMNGVSAWISKMPIFWTPYFFYPTKTGRATGLLTPSLKWSSSRGLIVSQEFFLCINDYMDATLGLTYHTIIGLQENLQFRNAFDQFSRGELEFEHIKEDESPSDNRDPEERWKITYEQNALMPWDIRGTANVNYQSDETYSDDYGDTTNGIDRFMDSRVSLSKYWGTASLTLDGSYEKEFSSFQDGRLEHLPRLEFYTGYRNLSKNWRYQVRMKGERLYRSDSATASGEDDDGPWSEIRRLEEEAMRGYFYGEIWYNFDKIPWMDFVPWISVDERVWDTQRVFDSDYAGGTWATYDSDPLETENDWKAGLYESGDGLHRHIFRAGFDFHGPRFYRIFDMLGYKRLTRMKNLIEPHISFTYTPELLGQSRIMEFDTEDVVDAETRVTWSVTSRFLMKLKTKSKKKGQRKTSDESADESDANLDVEETEPSVTPMNFDMSDTESSTASSSDETSDFVDEETGENESTAAVVDRDGVIKEFGYFTLSQSYDFYKRKNWDEREVKAGEDERIYHPLSNLKLEVTVNPFSNIYLSGRVEYDMWHDEFSNGYLYSHWKQKKWKFGFRWDFTRNFLDDYYDNHALALEGGVHLNDRWSFNSWVKYDFTKEYAPYAYLDLTYMAQCWGITLHTFYKNNREFDYSARTYEDDQEIKFGISFHLKNVDTIDTDSFGRFWWSDDR